MYFATPELLNPDALICRAVKWVSWAGPYAGMNGWVGLGWVCKLLGRIRLGEET